MCFRPSAVTSSNSDMQESTCPTCGMPVASAPGTTAGTCPHCGNAIPVNESGTQVPMSSDEKRIL